MTRDDDRSIIGGASLGARASTVPPSYGVSPNASAPPVALDAFGNGTQPAGSDARRDQFAEAMPPGKPGRGKTFARFALLFVVLAALALGVAVFQVLNSFELASVDPLGPTIVWLVVFGVAAIAAVVGVFLAVIALVLCRPRIVPVIALAFSLALPVAAVGLAATFGTYVLKENAVADLRAGGFVTSRAVDVLESWNVEVGPLRELIRSLGQTEGPR